MMFLDAFLILTGEVVIQTMENKNIDQIDDLKSQQKLWKQDSIFSIRVLNIGEKQKQPVNFAITLNIMHSKNLTVASVDRTRAVVSFRDFHTGLIVANTRKVGNNVQYRSVMQEFQKQVMQACREELDNVIEVLCQDEQKNPAAYAENFKPTKQIESEGYDSCADGLFVFKQIKQQIGLIGPMAPCEVNQYLVFDDTIITDQLATYRLPYKDPLKQELTQEQKDLVEKFLSVFVTHTNMNILSWYLGAAITNVPLYHANISKMLIVSSAGGGCGKNTLFGALSSALFTDNYRDIKPEFDDVFDKTNRFGAGDLLNVRYTQYNEANFSNSDQNVHDFSGLAVSEIKSLISDGYVSRERKFADVINNKVSSMQVVLTNNFPEIDEKRTDLTRRLLALTIKADRMEIKGRKLGLNSETEIYAFVKDNVQAFANYFASYYMNHKRQYTNTDYDAHDALESIADTAKIEADKAKKQDEKIKNALCTSPLDGLKLLADSLGVDSSKLLGHILNNDSNDVRLCDGKLYINRAKRFFDEMGLSAMRTQLIKLVPVEKKFRQNMFVFDLSYNMFDQLATTDKSENKPTDNKSENKLTDDKSENKLTDDKSENSDTVYSQQTNESDQHSKTTKSRKAILHASVDKLQTANKNHKLDKLIDYVKQHALANDENVTINDSCLYLTMDINFYHKLDIDISDFVYAVRLFVFRTRLFDHPMLVVDTQDNMGGDISE